MLQKSDDFDPSVESPKQQLDFLKEAMKNTHPNIDVCLLNNDQGSEVKIIHRKGMQKVTTKKMSYLNFICEYGETTVAEIKDKVLEDLDGKEDDNGFKGRKYWESIIFPSVDWTE